MGLGLYESRGLSGLYYWKAQKTSTVKRPIIAESPVISLLIGGALATSSRFDALIWWTPSADAIITKIEEAGFRVAAKNELSMSREMAEQFYKDQDGKDYFDSLTEHMIRYPGKLYCK